MKHYIMVMRNTRFFLVGPFDSQEAAGTWGSENAWGSGGEREGDPRWQTIELENASAPVEIMAPATAVIPA